MIKKRDFFNAVRLGSRLNDPKKKLFISHATEDKRAVAGPLADRLIEAGFSVWYDDYSLRAGDSIKQKIDEGLGECDFAVVVLSAAFFGKHWTRQELDGIASLESVRDSKVLIPVWYGVEEKDIAKFSPTLAGKVGVRFDSGLDNVVASITRAVNDAVVSGYVKTPAEPVVMYSEHHLGAAIKRKGSSWEELGESLLKEFRRLDRLEKKPK